MKAHFHSLLLFLVLSVACVDSSTLFRTNVRMKSRTVKGTVSSSISYTAKKNDRSKHDINHEVVFAVKNRNMDELEAILQDVANPKKPNSYLKYWTREEITEFTRNDVAVNKINAFCAQNGLKVTKETKYSDFITAIAPISTWESVLGTKFYEFSVEHHVTRETKYLHRALEYTMPEELFEHVEHLFNVVQIPPAAQKHIMMHTERPTQNIGADEFADETTPQVLNSYYNITNNTGNSLVSQSVYESINQTTSPSDLTTFQQTFNLHIQGLAGDINGHVSDTACAGYYYLNGCLEANLDVQYMMGIAQNIPTIYYYWGAEDFLLDWVTQVADMSDPPDIFSISYGAYELEYDASYLQSFDQEVIKLSMMGVTIFASSGDDGVAGFAARQSTTFCGYYPQFPADSPYVTSVGATNGPQAGRPEVTCQANENGAIITTGGGFSNQYSQPYFQTSLVSKYFSTVSGTVRQPATGYGSGRAYPDVSLLGHAYVVIANGNPTSVDGTSASSPVMAAFASLVNAKRKENNLPTLGWFNPTLYHYYESFIHDIDAGNNNCTAGNSASPPNCCSQGFYAVPGYDPVTGLGSVMFDKFFDTLSDAADLYNDELTDDFSTSSSSGLSAGAIAGIAIGVIIAVGVIVAVGYFIAVKCGRKQEPLLNDQV